MTEADSIPRLIPDPDADADIAKRIELINHRVLEEPRLFIDALQSLGNDATSETKSLDLDTLVVSLKPTPQGLILEFFRNRYDRESKYDAITEEEINTDLDHQLLVNAVRHGAHTKGLSQRMSEADDPLADERARDAVRRSGFAIFLGRAVRYSQLAATGTGG